MCDRKDAFDVPDVNEDEICRWYIRSRWTPTPWYPAETTDDGSTVDYTSIM